MTLVEELLIPQSLVVAFGEDGMLRIPYPLAPTGISGQK